MNLLGKLGFEPAEKGFIRDFVQEAKLPQFRGKGQKYAKEYGGGDS